VVAHTPLQGLDLVDCARANATLGVATACERCGYGTDAPKFLTNLRTACAQIGVTIAGLSDLDPATSHKIPEGVEIAPESPGVL